MFSQTLPKPMVAGLAEVRTAFPPNQARPGMTDTRGAKPGEVGRPRGPASGAVPLDASDRPAEPLQAENLRLGRNVEAADTLPFPDVATRNGVASAAVEDDAVIRRVLGGETDAFELLVRRHSRRVQGAVARHVPYDQREEVVQDAWVRAFQSLDGFQPGTRFGDWLTGIAVRASYDFWRQHYRRREVPESALGDSHREWIEAAGADQSAEQFRAHVQREEAQEVLQYALAHVSPEDRLVVSLVHLEGLSAQEAATQLGWSVVNVKVRAHRSRRRMRQALEAWLGKEIT
jgi:RNA polymerase sigma-70 factor (ECF subfamily)